jgi:hypothetical protein
MSKSTLIAQFFDLKVTAEVENYLRETRPPTQALEVIKTTFEAGMWAGIELMLGEDEQGN